MADAEAPTDDPATPFTDAERGHTIKLLSSVGTRTLLQTLAQLNADNADAGLIIATLLDRLPKERRQDPVIPI